MAARLRAGSWGWLGLAALLVSSLASAGKPPAYQQRAVSTQPSPLVIPAAAFLTEGWDPSSYEFVDGWIRGEGSTSYLVAPVYLPQDVTITGLKAYIFDASSSCDTGGEDVEVFLRRCALATGVSQEVAVTSSDGTSANVELTPTFQLNTAYATIDNSEYSYWLTAEICSAAHRLYAVVIEY